MIRGETSLDRLLRGMNPVLHGGQYMFCVLPHDTPVPSSAIAVFREEEATTIVIAREHAQGHRLDAVYAAAWITLTIHSDMDAIGFLAAIAKALAGERISCNVISAAYHDHLFVPYADGERAIEALRKLQRGS
jgi:hypothetical protein